MARICVVRQYHFPLDPRVRREVYALLDAGHDVDVLCLRQAGEPAYERNGSLRIIRLPLPRRRGGALNYVFQYAAFFSSAFLLAAALHLWRQYALIQVHSLPDALVFAALVPRLGGARVILDLHEPMPEFVASKFGKSMHHPLVRLVAWIEQRSIGFADAVLTCTESMKEQFVRRGGPPRKIAVILNGSDESVFHPRVARLSNAEAKHCVLISHGSVEERYGLDTAIRAIAALKDEIEGLRLDIYGDGSYVPELRRLARSLNVESRVYFSDGFVPLGQLVEAIAEADIGIVAIKQDAFRDLTLCNKMYDFIAMRKPAIVSRTRSVELAFGDDSFRLFASDDAADLAQAIRELHADPALRERLIRTAATAAESHRWPYHRDRYISIVNGLLGAPSASARLGTGAP